MGFIETILQKCSVMQWGIGFAKADVTDIIRKKKVDVKFTWLEQGKKLDFIADPFIFKNKEGNINLLYEDFSVEKNGTIALKVIDNNFKPVFQKTLLKTAYHLSYPFVYEEAGITYIIPESHQNGKVVIFEYDFSNNSLKNEKLLINRPLLDATILKHDDKYWLFASLGDGINDNKQLHIYYSDSLTGQYLPHRKNPVRDNLDGTRPAGNFIKVDGELYRPAQNCKEYYGKSITINRINTLTIDDFEETYHFEIAAEKSGDYKSGLHTINALDGVIVIDGIKFIFMPVKKASLFFKKQAKRLRGKVLNKTNDIYI